MKTAFPFIVALALGTAASVWGTQRSAGAALQPRPDVDVILGAFERHSLVALSEGAGHGQLETLDLFTRLIRDRRFPQTVRTIVIEFGNARYQPVMDRYLSGGAVPREELRQIWEQTTQISGVWSLPMYERMLAEVRAVNTARPDALRLRVLLGDPPIDWTKVTSPADEDMNDWRDAHLAHVIAREVMSRRDKALILIGGAHISRKVIFPTSLIHLLDARFPGQTWVVGVLDAGRIAPRIRSSLEGWTLPSGASVRGTWLGGLDVQQIGFTLSKGVVEDDVDALLLLTLAMPRLQEPAPMDAAYALELTRRRRLAEATLPFRGSKIRFERSAAVFTADAVEPLDAVLRELLRDRGLRVLVKAFADPAESDALALSQRRAALVVDWLAARGVERGRLLPKGCGAGRPLYFGSTAAERAVCRRAEIVHLTPTAGCDPPW